MKFRSPDDAAREYLRLGGALAAPRAQCLTVTAGEKPADSCPRCQGIDSFVGHDRRHGTELLRCYRCGTPWPIEIAEVPRQRIDGGRRGGAEERMARLTTLGMILGRLGTWERRTLLLACCGDLSLPAIASECARRWPRRAVPWSQYRVRSDLEAARDRLEKLLRRAGLLSEEGGKWS